MRPPLIGINTDSYSDSGGPLQAVRPQYWRAVAATGAMPVLLPPIDDPVRLARALEPLDGFVMIGGDDLPGERYGCKTMPTSILLPRDRQSADFVLMDALVAARKPTLAICLGCQELNIRMGGTLHQDIVFERPDSTVRHYSKSGDVPMHEVEITKACLLMQALAAGDRPVTVNSKHHQAINRLGTGLRVAARAPDGIIEALEIEDHPWFVAVQWHPELMADEGDPVQMRLFQALADQASARSH